MEPSDAVGGPVARARAATVSEVERAWHGLLITACRACASMETSRTRMDHACTSERTCREVFDHACASTKTSGDVFDHVRASRKASGTWSDHACAWSKNVGAQLHACSRVVRTADRAS